VDLPAPGAPATTQTGAVVMPLLSPTRVLAPPDRTILLIGRNVSRDRRGLHDRRGLRDR
jgi:hypothetical protein